MADAQAPLVYSFEAAAVAQLIRELRHCIGMRDEQIAALLVVRTEELPAWETGRQSTSLAALSALAEMFDVPLDVLTRDLLAAVERYTTAKETKRRDGEMADECRGDGRGDGKSSCDARTPSPTSVEQTLHQHRTRRITRDEAYTRLLNTLVENAREVGG